MRILTGQSDVCKFSRWNHFSSNRHLFYKQTIQKMKSLRFYFWFNFGPEEREHEADVRVKADNITLSH